MSGERPAYRLAPLPEAPPPLLPEDARRQPSKLLDPRRRVVTFAGRAEELRELNAWLDSPRRAAVRLINGSAGQGKTRLAQYFARLSAERGWGVHVAHPRDRFGSGDAMAATPQVGHGGKVLVLIDYAERWALDHLLSVVSDIQGEEGDGLRFLLLGRPAGLWWYGLSHRLEDNHGLFADAVQLSVFAASPDERLAAFTRARDCFAEALGVPDAAAVRPPAAMDDDAYGVALTIHMAALAALDAHIHAEAAPDDPGRLSEYLLGRELRYWQDLHRRGGELPSVDANTMGRAVFAASLTGPHPHARGVTVIKRANLADDPVAVERILDAHALCYPPQDQATVLEPLLPDRLAEDFVALATPGHPYAYPADAWTVTSLRRLFDISEREDGGTPSEAYAKQALTILIETAVRWKHVARNHLDPLLREHPRLALTAGGAALITLARIPHLDPGVLEAIEPHLPRQDIDLDMGIAALTERLTEHRLSAAPDRAEQGRLHLALGIRKGIAGFEGQAVGSLEQAVAFFRESPAAQADLASALLNLGISYLHLGRNEAAVAVLQEAASLHQQAVPDGKRLATSIDMLQIAMSRSGRRHEALELSRTLIKAWQRYPAEDNEASAMRARALLNHGNRLTEEKGTGGAGQAMAATKEAVGIFRRLTEADPGAYSPDLARALLNWSDDLFRAGQRKNALAAITEAVARYREMSEVNSAAFQTDYGKALFNLGALLGKMHRCQEAFDATSAALSVFHGERLDSSDSNQAMVALSQTALAALLVDLNKPHDAAARAREAVTLTRKHGLTGSAGDREHIAQAMGYLAVKLAIEKIWGEALEAADLCGQMSGRLAAEDRSFSEYAKYAAGIPMAIQAAMADPVLHEMMRTEVREIRDRNRPASIPQGRKKPKSKKKPGANPA